MKGVPISHVFSALMACCCLACSSNDGRRDIRDYYFPFSELVDGMVYEYHAVNNDSLAPSYWEYFSEITDEGAFLNSTNYNYDFLPVQTVREERISNGVKLRELTLFDRDSLGKEIITNVEIEANDVFPFSVRDSGGVFIFNISWQMPSEPGTTYTLIKNRRYTGDTTYVFEGKTYDCIVFQVNELFEQDNEGVLEQQFSGVEFYAKGLGLVYYRKEISEEFTLEYELAEIKPVD